MFNIPPHKYLAPVSDAELENAAADVDVDDDLDADLSGADRGDTFAPEPVVPVAPTAPAAPIAP